MRITGGRYRGRIVTCPPGHIRPAMDRMRESMFAIFGSIEGLSFLDLFAGSGVVSLEALSRGASKALLVEKDAGKRKILLENLKIANDYPPGAISLLIRPVERVLKSGMDRFDIVHLDPPFAYRNKAQFLELAEQAGQPAPDGVLTMHCPAEDVLPERVGRLYCSDRRRYGQSVLVFYTEAQ